VSPPPGPIIDGLDNPDAVQPAMKSESGNKPVLTWFQAAESHPCNADEAGLLRDDLHVAECVEQRDISACEVERVLVGVREQVLQREVAAGVPQIATTEP
jgi:hypothetical protein